MEDLCHLSFTLSGAMIFLGGKAGSVKEGYEISQHLIKSGKAFDKFLKMVKLQGGDISFIKNPGKFPKPKNVIGISAEAEGYITTVRTDQLGEISMELGAGRITREDKIDYNAGIIFNFKIGQMVGKNDIIAVFHTNKEKELDVLINKFYNLLSVSSKKPRTNNLIVETII